MFTGNCSYGFQDFFPDLQVIWRIVVFAEWTLLSLPWEWFCVSQHWIWIDILKAILSELQSLPVSESSGTTATGHQDDHSVTGSHWGFLSLLPVKEEQRSWWIESQPLLSWLSWHVSAVLPGIGNDVATHWGYAGTISSLTSPALSCLWQPALSLLCVSVWSQCC